MTFWNDLLGDVRKGFGLPETIDPNHEYVYCTGEFGLHQYWYRDRFGNYWLYSNAPEGHKDYDPHAGEAIIDPDQPMPHSAPEFFTQDRLKRNQAVPSEANVHENAEYSESDLRNIWKEMYQAPDGQPRYIYLDKDIRENLDLWVQHQLRVVDAVIPKYRKFANNLFQSSHPKDKVFGAILMLVDQGCFTVEELISAEVSDLEFVDQTVLLLGRKFLCDLPFYDFMTSIKGARDPQETLFQLNTIYGKSQIGLNHINSFFAAMRVSPIFLLYWNASQMFSRISHRLAAEQVPPDQIRRLALDEVGMALNLGEDADCLVDIRLQDVIEENYHSLGKSFARVSGDSLGVFVVLSDLTSRKPDELQFSMWIHTEPMHQSTPQEDEALEAELEQAHAVAEAQKNPEQQAEGIGPSPTGEGASPAPGDGPAPPAGKEGE